MSSVETEEKGGGGVEVKETVAAPVSAAVAAADDESVPNAAIDTPAPAAAKELEVTLGAPKEVVAVAPTPTKPLESEEPIEKISPSEMPEKQVEETPEPPVSSDPSPSPSPVVPKVRPKF